MEFLIYKYQTATGVDYRIGKQRNGSVYVGTIEADKKSTAIIRLQATLHEAIKQVRGYKR